VPRQFAGLSVKRVDPCFLRYGATAAVVPLSRDQFATLSPDEEPVRVWHVALGSLALVALVLVFGMRHAADAGSESVLEPTRLYRTLPPTPAPVRPAPPRSVPVKASRLRVKPQRLHLGNPRVQTAPRVRSARTAPAYDPPPVAPGPPPTLDIPVAPYVEEGPDVCKTDPPDSLDECAERTSAASMEACVQYYVDCYG
jgi:hypothetical protein